MLSAYQFTEPKCLNIPLSLNRISLECESGYVLLEDNFAIGVIDKSSFEYDNNTLNINERNV